DLMQLQRLLENRGVFQGGGFLLRGKALEEKEALFRPLFLKAAHDNICISDIYGENHKAFISSGDGIWRGLLLGNKKPGAVQGVADGSCEHSGRDHFADRVNAHKGADEQENILPADEA